MIILEIRFRKEEEVFCRYNIVVTRNSCVAGIRWLNNFKTGELSEW